MLEVFVSFEESYNNGYFDWCKLGLGTLQDSIFLPVVHGLFKMRLGINILFQQDSLKISSYEQIRNIKSLWSSMNFSDQ